MADPTSPLYCPTSHSSQVSSGSVIVPANPALHSQSPGLVLPASAVPESSGHEVHASSPRASLYSPTSHALHVSAGAWMSPVYPALHSQSVTSSLPAPAVDESAGQGVHSSSPTVALYVSASQASHVSAGAVIVPVNPASHKQAVTAVLPVPPVVASSGQSVHCRNASFCVSFPMLVPSLSW